MQGRARSMRTTVTKRRGDWPAFASVADDAAKANVTGCSVDRLAHARCRAKAMRVFGRAQERAALYHTPRHSDVEPARIIAAGRITAARVAQRTTTVCDPAMLPVPIRGPFPHVTGHVVQAVIVGREG